MNKSICLFWLMLRLYNMRQIDEIFSPKSKPGEAYRTSLRQPSKFKKIQKLIIYLIWLPNYFPTFPFSFPFSFPSPISFHHTFMSWAIVTLAQNSGTFSREQSKEEIKFLSCFWKTVPRVVHGVIQNLFYASCGCLFWFVCLLWCMRKCTQMHNVCLCITLSDFTGPTNLILCLSASKLLSASNILYRIYIGRCQ